MGAREAASLVFSVAPRVGQTGVISFGNGMDQIKNKDHCYESRNTAPKFPNENLSSLLRHTHIH
jgi:hypothetical protein